MIVLVFLLDNHLKFMFQLELSDLLFTNASSYPTGSNSPTMRGINMATCLGTIILR